MLGARLLLVHVADGWAARHFDELKLRESEEIRGDREYPRAALRRARAARIRDACPAGHGRSRD